MPTWRIRASFNEILDVVARQCGLVFKAPGRLAGLDALDEYLELHRGERVTVVIDEAQVLPDPVVEELRLLSNCGPGRESALHFIFVGQPEFLHRLESPGFRQLNERIGARAMLNPLPPREAYEYIDFRLNSRKGNIRDIFAPAALTHIVEKSGGVPRRIDVLCHNSMLLAYTSNSSRVRLQHAQSAAAEYADLFTASSKPIPERAASAPARRQWRTVATFAALGIAAIGAGWLWSSFSTPPRPYGLSAEAATPATKPVRAAEALPAVPAAKPSVTNTNFLPKTASAEAAIMPLPEASTEKPQPPADPSNHRVRQIRVKQGDTVMEIARRNTASRPALPDLVAANPQLSDVNRIFPGQVVNVPDSDSPKSGEQVEQ